MKPVEHPLSALDAAFLHLDTARTPMTIGSVGVFDGGPLTDGRGRIRLDEVKAAMAARLDLLPKLRRKVVAAPLPDLPPRWVDDPAFDLDRHIRLGAVPSPGDRAALAATVAGLFESPLDRDRPLWELWLLDGLAGGRVALVEKLHHALADGLAGVEVASLLLDRQARPAAPLAARRPWHPRPGWPGPAVVAHDAERLARWPLRLAAGAARAALHPGRSLDDLGAVGGALATYLTPRLVAPRLGLNVPVGRRRRLVLVEQSLADTDRLRRQTGATVNDVLLTAVTGGVRQLLETRGEPVQGRQVQVLVPVGLGHDHVTLGNQVSGLVVRLPLGFEDPSERLGLVARAVADRKVHHQALAGQVLLGLAEPLPQPVLGAVARAAHHQPVVNLVVTNVPGPTDPLYALGAELLEAYPVVPLGGNLPFAVAAVSYRDQLGIGVLADWDAGRDVQVLVDAMTDDFARLAGPGRGRRARSAAALGAGVA